MTNAQSTLLHILPNSRSNPVPSLSQAIIQSLPRDCTVIITKYYRRTIAHTLVHLNYLLYCTAHDRYHYRHGDIRHSPQESVQSGAIHLLSSSAPTDGDMSREFISLNEHVIH